MGINHGTTVDHILPVIGQRQLYQGLQQGILDTLFCQTAKPDIYGVPFAVATHACPATDNVHARKAEANQLSPIPDPSDRLGQA